MWSLNTNYIVQCMGKTYCVQFNGTLWNSIVSYSYIEWCMYYSEVNIQVSFDFSALERFWNNRHISQSLAVPVTVVVIQVTDRETSDNDVWLAQSIAGYKIWYIYEMQNVSQISYVMSNSDILHVSRIRNLFNKLNNFTNEIILESRHITCNIKFPICWYTMGLFVD